MTFAQIFVLIYSQSQLLKVRDSLQIFGLLKLADLTENGTEYEFFFLLASDYDSIHSEDIKHVWYFEPILEHVVSICHASSSNKVHVSAWASMFGQCKSQVVCDPQSFSVWYLCQRILIPRRHILTLLTMRIDLMHQKNKGTAIFRILLLNFRFCCRSVYLYGITV